MISVNQDRSYYLPKGKMDIRVTRRTIYINGDPAICCVSKKDSIHDVEIVGDVENIELEAKDCEVKIYGNLETACIKEGNLHVLGYQTQAVSA